MVSRLTQIPAILPYQRAWLRADVLAGLATGAVVIPQAMAYATVAGMPVQVGLYTCMVPLIVYAFLGGSRTASVTTTSTIATLSASALLSAGAVIGSPDAEARLVTLTFLVGIFLLVARFLHLGSIIENVNQATLLGIKVGVGLTVAASQLPKLLGVPPDPKEDGFFGLLRSAFAELSHANAVTIGLSVAAIAVLLAMSRWTPRIPGPLIVVAAGILLAAYAGLPQHGVALIPQVAQGIPVPTLPSLQHIPDLVPGALAIALMAFLETLAVASSVRRPDEPAVDPNREISATGFAAILGALTHSLPPAGGFSQTGVNLKAGAKSQVSGLVTAALAVLVAVALAPVLSELPQAILGAMVFVAVLGLIDVDALSQLYRFERHEFALAAVVAATALTVGLLPAVAAGVVLTLYSVLRELNRAHVAQLVSQHELWVEGPENVLAEPADPLVVRTRLGLYTANLRPNVDGIRGMVSECSPAPAVLVWDLSAQPVLTSTMLNGLRDAETELAGIRVIYAALQEALHETAQRWPWWQQVESEGRYFPTVSAAVSA